MLIALAVTVACGIILRCESRYGTVYGRKLGSEEWTKFYSERTAAKTQGFSPNRSNLVETTGCDMGGIVAATQVTILQNVNPEAGVRAGNGFETPRTMWCVNWLTFSGCLLILLR